VTDLPPLSDLQWAILRHVARSAAEDTDSRDGWCRWSTSDDWPWAWDDYRPLYVHDLLDRRETWKDVLLRPSEYGWSLLHTRGQ
jgi:hypothetical protein